MLTSRDAAVWLNIEDFLEWVFGIDTVLAAIRTLLELPSRSGLCDRVQKQAARIEESEHQVKTLQAWTRIRG